MSLPVNEKDEKKLEELYLREEEDLIKTLAPRYGIPYADLSAVSIETDALKLIPEEEARTLLMAPFKIIGRNLYIGLLSPRKEGVDAKLEELKEKKYAVSLYLVSKVSLERAWSRYKEVSTSVETKSGILDISKEDLEKMAASLKSVELIKSFAESTLKESKAHKVTKMLEIILGGAVATGASDVHIEPEEKKVRFRLRLDGVLEDVLFFDYNTYNLLSSRLKILSELKLSTKKSAQDGRFSIKLGDDDIEVRVSFVPGGYGESIVLRILNPKAIRVSFDNLGIAPRLLKILDREISKPNGIILTTGPTGSGKTTTLYAFLKKVYTPDVKIITVEDPVEYHLEGITQTQIDERKGYTFLDGLRGALRQDPDIMMVGEIRDAETAKTAINAALTGHLVFSTLHTNTASGAIPRLIDLDVNPKIISSALNVAVAQRLVRKLCENCKREKPLESAELKIIESTLARMKNEGADAGAPVPETPFKIFDAAGCEKCNNTGYKGRIGIFEAILMDEAIERLVVSNPSEREIKKAALPQRIPDMAEDGILKVLSGVTTLEELSRVVELTENF